MTPRRRAAEGVFGRILQVPGSAAVEESEAAGAWNRLLERCVPRRRLGTFWRRGGKKR